MGIILNGSSVTAGAVSINAIANSSDFPTLGDIKKGQIYYITADVIDNNPSKTNTEQQFIAGDEITWTGSSWIAFGSRPNEEIPVGAVDGVNKVFTLQRVPRDGSLSISVGGLEQSSSGDYSIDGKIITFVVAPEPGESVEANYI